MLRPISTTMQGSPVVPLTFLPYLSIDLGEIPGIIPSSRQPERCRPSSVASQLSGSSDHVEIRLFLSDQAYDVFGSSSSWGRRVVLANSDAFGTSNDCATNLADGGCEWSRHAQIRDRCRTGGVHHCLPEPSLRVCGSTRLFSRFNTE